ncbi:MAG: amidohydrolase [Alphaproteobacteria bacterium]|nr:amidohydrolase [Alphaproteobacteria bacterium]
MVIDFSSRPPLPEFGVRVGHLSNYRRVYRSSEAAAAAAEGGDEDRLAAYLAAYDAVDARHVVVRAKDTETTFGLKTTNEFVAGFCRAHAPRFIGFAGVDPHKGMAAIREFEHAVKELGLRGLNLQCFEHKIAINDKKLYPLYAKCIELDVPVTIHSSINFSTECLMEHGRPILLDEVMVHFPELRVVAAPPGWPWVQELIGVAWRHKNVFIGVSAVRPKYLEAEDSGYEPLVKYGNSVLQDQIVFGTSHPLQPIGRAFEEVRALPLKPDVMEKWVHGNAARLLGVD